MTDLRQRRKNLNPIILIILISFIIRIWGINHNFPDVNRYFYETEEHSSIQIAMGFGTGDLNPHSFNKPSLFYYLLFALYGGFYVLGKIVGFFASVPEFVRFYFYNTWVFYLIARLLALTFGAACVYILYVTGKKIFNRKTALIASAMLAVSPIHTEFSQLALPDISGLFLAMVAIYYSLSVYESFSLKSIVLSSLFAGLAMSAKYYYGFAFFALAMVMLLHVIKEKSFGFSYFKKIFIGLFFLVIGFIIGTPFAALDYKYFLSSLLELERAKTGAGVILLSQKDIIPNWWIEHLFQLANTNILGIGLLTISLVGIIHAVLRHRWQDIVLLVIIISSYSFFSYRFFSVEKWHFSPAHYLLLIIPYVLLLGAEVMVKLFDKFPANKLLPGTLLSLILLPPLAAVCLRDNLNSHQDTKAIAKKWIEGHIPAGSNILMDEIYVPQLSLTDSCLSRLTNIRLAHPSILLPSYRKIKTKNKYTYLRDESLTRQGIPYNIYTIESSAICTDMEQYKEKYRIEYVILSGLTKDVYLKIVPFNINKDRMLEFYNSVENSCELIKEFEPNRIDLPGPKIEIYQVK